MSPRQLATLLTLSTVLGYLGAPAAAQEDADRVAVIRVLQDRLAQYSDLACARPLAEAQGLVDAWERSAEKAGQRRDRAYDAMMSAPLGYGLVDLYGGQMRRAERDQSRAERQADNFSQQVPGAAAQAGACLEGMRLRRAEIQAILADPGKLNQTVEQYRTFQREASATARSIFEETKSFADTLLASPGPAQLLIARAADLQARQRATLNRFRGVPVKPEDRLLVEQVGKTWVHIDEALQAIRREEAAATELAGLQVQHDQARRRLAVQTTILERANFDQLTRALQGAQLAAKDTRKAGELRRGALRVAISDMTQTAEASK
jgi:hypothetical protein